MMACARSAMHSLVSIAEMLFLTVFSVIPSCRPMVGLFRWRASSDRIWTSRAVSSGNAAALPGGGAEVADQPAGDAGSEHCVAFGYGSNGSDDLVAACALQQVALGAGLHGGED